LSKGYENGNIDFAPSPKMDGSSTYYVPGRIEVDWLAAGAKNPGGAIACALSSGILQKSAYYKPLYEELRYKVIGYSEEQKQLLEELQDFSIFTPIPSRMEGVGNWDSAGMWSMIDDVSAWGVPWSTCLETYYPTFQSEVDRANELLANSKK